MSDNFKLNTIVLDDLDYFHISDFQKQDDYSTSEKKHLLLNFMLKK